MHDLRLTMDQESHSENTWDNRKSRNALEVDYADIVRTLDDLKPVHGLLSKSGGACVNSNRRVMGNPPIPMDHQCIHQDPKHHHHADGPLAHQSELCILSNRNGRPDTS